jgi:phage N-6-adenine-methyltransferase
MNPVHFSSATDLWSTPQDFFDALNAEFNFTLDVCATAENAKCPKFYTKEDDGLSQPWWFYGTNAGREHGAAFVNPPYGKEIGRWVKKASEEAQPGFTIVALLPARTDTKWFQDYVLPYAELRWVRGRLKFGGAKNSAPFPSVVAIYRGRK